MLARYCGADRGARVWRTVTPAALPEGVRRRQQAAAKGGAERAAEQARAAGAVTQALRHADLQGSPERVRVQREPFEARGDRAEAFAPNTRFLKERLWHVEVTFAQPQRGPIVIGDGRFLGLGIMAPVQRHEGTHAFVIEGLAGALECEEVARALRRAVMARVQNTLGPRADLGPFFSGHERDGSPAQSLHPHLTFAFDRGSRRLLILAPHVVEHRPATRDEKSNLAILDRALADFRTLRVPSVGSLALRALSTDADADPLFAASRVWESITPYQVTRHAKHVRADEALASDLRAECRRLGLPEPRVATRDTRGVPGLGLLGGARLTFEVAVAGPIVIGKSRHFGGGLFASGPPVGEAG